MIEIKGGYKRQEQEQIERRGMVKELKELLDGYVEDIPKLVSTFRRIICDSFNDITGQQDAYREILLAICCAVKSGEMENLKHGGRNIESYLIIAAKNICSDIMEEDVDVLKGKRAPLINKKEREKIPSFMRIIKSGEWASGDKVRIGQRYQKKNVVFCEEYRKDILRRYYNHETEKDILKFYNNKGIDVTILGINWIRTLHRELLEYIKNDYITKKDENVDHDLYDKLCPIKIEGKSKGDSEEEDEEQLGIEEKAALPLGGERYNPDDDDYMWQGEDSEPIEPGIIFWPTISSEAKTKTKKEIHEIVVSLYQFDLAKFAYAEQYNLDDIIVPSSSLSKRIDRAITRFITSDQTAMIIPDQTKGEILKRLKFVKSGEIEIEIKTISKIFKIEEKEIYNLLSAFKRWGDKDPELRPTRGKPYLTPEKLYYLKEKTIKRMELCRETMRLAIQFTDNVEEREALFWMLVRQKSATAVALALGKDSVNWTNNLKKRFFNYTKDSEKLRKLWNDLQEITRLDRETEE